MWILRIFLGILILLNLFAIYYFSDQDNTESTKESTAVTEHVAKVVIPDYNQKTPKEQKKIIKELHPPVRKLAHMTEFGSLGALTFLLLSTFSPGIALAYPGGILFPLLCAVADEFHQKFSFGRSAQFSDVLIDTCGAIFTCSVLLLIFTVILYKKQKKANS